VRRTRTFGRASSRVLLLAVAACDGHAVLEVGRIGYTAEELGVLGAAQREELIVLTAFGLATADQRLADVAGPYVRRELRSLILQRAALEIGAVSAGLDEVDVKAAYAVDPEYELTVRHLVVLAERWRSQEARAAARERAEEALRRAESGEDFQGLVAEYSEEPGAAQRGGLLQPGRAGSWVPAFWRAARSLEVGEVSGVVETEYGFHVLRLERRDTVPFEEARSRFLEDLVGLSDALARSTEWLEARSRGAAVDTAAIAAWQSGRDPGAPLVQWPEGGLEPYESGDLDEYILTLPPESAAALRTSAPDQTAESVLAVARSNALMQYAAGLGIEPTAAQRLAVERRWSERLRGWAGDLGFAPRQPDHQVKARALAALDPRRQEALIARSEVFRLELAVLRLYPVSDWAGAPR
jgi:hypothetical protein